MCNDRTTQFIVFSIVLQEVKAEKVEGKNDLMFH